MHLASITGLPFGRVAVSASRHVEIGAASGPWAEVAWPAQQRAGDALALLQYALALADVLARGGWAEARRDRDNRRNSNPLAGWAWAVTCSGFPEARAEWSGEAVSASAVLARLR
jgi:hypothetical protein